MTIFPTGSVEEQLDVLLYEVAKALQLPPTLWDQADAHYRALGRWIERPESLLAPYRPEIYPQGSFALGTTNPPWGRDEYDLDFVIELALYGGDPMTLLKLLRACVSEHADWKKRLEPLKRGIRLRYANQFHLDMIASRPDLSRRHWRDSIEVPDRKLQDWTCSNPKGYRRWFESRCAEERSLLVKAQAPLPAAESIGEKAILKLIAQLTKRHRDVEFQGGEGAPRSIVLTTLAGLLYDGESSLYRGMCSFTHRLGMEVQRSGAEPLVVCNPTNSEECFSECWIAKPQEYAAFAQWLDRFRVRLVRLASLRGLEEIRNALAELFGEKPTDRAVHAFTERMHNERREQTLRMSPRATLTTTGGTGLVIPKHRFYGRH